MITNKERKILANLSNGIPDIVFIGKNGITSEVIDQIKNNLKARELIKCKVQQNSSVNAREAADQIADMIHCDIVRVVGSKFILYRKNPNLIDHVLKS